MKIVKFILVSVYLVVAGYFVAAPLFADNRTEIAEGTLLSELSEANIKYVNGFLVYENSEQINQSIQENAKDNAVSNIIGLIAFATTGSGWTTTTTTTHATDKILVRYCGQGYKREMADYCKNNSLDFNKYTQGITFDDSEYVRLPDITMILSGAFDGDVSLRFVDFVDCTKAVYVPEGAFEQSPNLAYFLGAVSSFTRNPDKSEDAKIWQSDYWKADYLLVTEQLNTEYGLEESWTSIDEGNYPRLYWVTHGFKSLVFFGLLPLLVAGALAILFIAFGGMGGDFSMWFVPIAFTFPATIVVENLIAKGSALGIEMNEYTIWNLILLGICLLIQLITVAFSD